VGRSTKRQLGRICCTQPADSAAQGVPPDGAELFGDVGRRQQDAAGGRTGGGIAVGVQTDRAGLETGQDRSEVVDGGEGGDQCAGRPASGYLQQR
jgi:hypothetical protein